LWCKIETYAYVCVQRRWMLINGVGWIFIVDFVGRNTFVVYSIGWKGIGMITKRLFA